MAIKAYIAESTASNMTLRSVTDYTRLMRSINEEVDELSKLFDVHRRALAGIVFVTSDEDDSRLQHDSPKAPSAALLKSMVPNMGQLEKNYEIVSRLHSKLEEVRMMEADLEIRFAREDDLAPMAKKAIAELRVIQEKIVRTLGNAYKFLQNLARSSLPLSCNVFINTISSALSKTLDYQSAEPYLYVYPKDGTITFSHFLELKGLTDLSGKSFRELFIVISFTLTDKGRDTHVNVLNKFQAPGTFPLGKQVADTKVAIKTIAALLDLDNFDNAINRIPINQLLDPKFLVKQVFTAEGHINRIEADEDSLTFFLKPTVDSAAKVGMIAQQLNVELQTFTRRTQARLRMKIAPTKTSSKITFFFVREPGQVVDMNDLRFLQDRFNLAPSAVERIRDIINKE